MRYCARCVYPENSRPTITFDGQGICSGCKVQESKKHIDWQGREKMLREILIHYKQEAHRTGNLYDCIIPVSGGKDSHYQVYLVKEVYGLNPLLVTYNHTFNTKIGIRNLSNLVKEFGCDLIRFTANPDSVRKIARYMVTKIGDITWHYHAGIFTFPFHIAVKYRIPLLIWGEHGYSEMTGIFRLEDIPEFTKWCRQEYEMRGYEVEDLINAESGLTRRELAPYIFPSDEEIEEVGVRGIFIGNYIEWDSRRLADMLMREHGFEIARGKRDRTFSLYHKIDDHANDVHDYLRYLKFGYGRGTDHASLEIRAGRMTREEGIEMVRQYDHVRPSSLDVYLDFLGMTEAELESAIEKDRDPAIWEKNSSGKWTLKDSVVNHVDDEQVEAARLPLVPEDDRTFGRNNRHLYYSDKFQPLAPSERRGVSRDSEEGFIIL